MKKMLKLSYNAFEFIRNELESFPLVDVAVKKTALGGRIQKVRAGLARLNVELDDAAILELYVPIEVLSSNIDKLERVDTSSEVIERLKEKLLAALNSFPDVSQLSSVGEDNPVLLKTPEITAVKEFVQSVLGIRLKEDASFSEFAETVQRFFGNEKHKAEIAQFAINLMTVYSSPAKENSLLVKNNENFNIGRLFCYQLALAAGYDAENLIIDLLKEMKDCIEGPQCIVQVVNNILINDVWPLLLDVKFLENADVLNEYLEALRSLAYHTRDGVLGVYFGYGASDGIYTELQRIYNSLQIHVMRLRIETKLLPALEAELRNKESQIKALEEPRELREKQDVQQLNVMIPETYLPLTLNLNSFIDDKMSEREDIATVQQVIDASSALDVLLTAAQYPFSAINKMVEEEYPRQLTAIKSKLGPKAKMFRPNLVNQILDDLTIEMAINGPSPGHCVDVRRQATSTYITDFHF